MCLDPGDIDGGISRFTGSDRLVAEYLIEEVINQLVEQDREFLVTTSVADRLAAGLANALTGRDDGQLTLERLAAHNALVVDLAGRSEWFSVHPLLRELLLHRLSRDRPGVVADLHLGASRWFAARVQPSTGTLLAAALGHYLLHDFEAMAQDTRDAGALIDDVPPKDRPAASVMIALLELVRARALNPAATTRTAVRLLDLLDTITRMQLPIIEHYRVIASNNIALGQLWAGDLAAAEMKLATVQTRCVEMGLGLVELSTHAHLALLDAIHGRIPDAARRADAAQLIAERRGWSSEPQALALYAALALTGIATHRSGRHRAILERSCRSGATESSSFDRQPSRGRSHAHRSVTHGRIRATERGLCPCGYWRGRTNLADVMLRGRDVLASHSQTDGGNLWPRSRRQMARRSSTRTGGQGSRSSSATAGRFRATTGTPRCCSSCSTATGSSPMIGAGTDGPRRPAKVTTWTTMPTTWLR